MVQENAAPGNGRIDRRSNWLPTSTRTVQEAQCAPPTVHRRRLQLRGRGRDFGRRQNRPEGSHRKSASWYGLMGGGGRPTVCSGVGPVGSGMFENERAGRPSEPPGQACRAASRFRLASRTARVVEESTPRGIGDQVQRGIKAGSSAGVPATVSSCGARFDSDCPPVAKAAARSAPDSGDLRGWFVRSE